jgi:hypothetical protein
MNISGLQEAIFTKLNALPSLAGKVFDHVPQSTAKPYAVLGDWTGDEFDTDDTAGVEPTLTLHFWSDKRGMEEIQQLMDAARTALHNVSYTVSGEVVVLAQFEFFQLMVDPDGLTRHGVQRFRFIMTEE